MCVLSCSVISDLCNPMDYRLPGSSVHGIFQARILEWITISSSKGSSCPGIKPVCPSSSALQMYSLTTEPLGCVCESCSVVSNSLQPHGLHSLCNSPAQNSGVSNLSLLLGIFPTQGLNPGLPHCRQTLHQLSYKMAKLYGRCCTLSFTYTYIYIYKAVLNILISL